MTTTKTTARIIDTTSRTEIKGRVRFVTFWTGNGANIPAVLTDADASELSGGVTRSKLVETLRNAERDNAERTAMGNVARGYTTVYVRDNGCPDAEGAWWPAEIAG